MTLGNGGNAVLACPDFPFGPREEIGMLLAILPRPIIDLKERHDHDAVVQFFNGGLCPHLQGDALLNAGVGQVCRTAFGMAMENDRVDALHGARIGDLRNEHLVGVSYPVNG